MYKIGNTAMKCPRCKVEYEVSHIALVAVFISCPECDLGFVFFRNDLIRPTPLKVKVDDGLVRELMEFKIFSPKTEEIVKKLCKIKDRGEFLKGNNEELVLQYYRKYGEDIFRFSKEIIEMIKKDWVIKINVDVCEG